MIEIISVRFVCIIRRTVLPQRVVICSLLLFYLSVSVICGSDVCVLCRRPDNVTKHYLSLVSVFCSPLCFVDEIVFSLSVTQGVLLYKTMLRRVSTMIPVEK